MGDDEVIRRMAKNIIAALNFYQTIIEEDCTF